MFKTLLEILTTASQIPTHFTEPWNTLGQSARALCRKVFAAPKRQRGPRWVNACNGEQPTPDVDAFLDDIEAVCRVHGMCLGHQDGNGAFEVKKLDPQYLDWLAAAHDARNTP